MTTELDKLQPLIDKHKGKLCDCNAVNHSNWTSSADDEIHVVFKTEDQLMAFIKARDEAIAAHAPLKEIPRTMRVTNAELIASIDALQSAFDHARDMMRTYVHERDLKKELPSEVDVDKLFAFGRLLRAVNREHERKQS